MLFTARSDSTTPLPKILITIGQNDQNESFHRMLQWLRQLVVCIGDPAIIAEPNCWIENGLILPSLRVAVFKKYIFHWQIYGGEAQEHSVKLILV